MNHKALYEYATGAKNVTIKPYGDNYQAAGRRIDLPETFYSVGMVSILPDRFLDNFTEKDLFYAVSVRKHNELVRASSAPKCTCCHCCKAH